MTTQSHPASGSNRSFVIAMLLLMAAALVTIPGYLSLREGLFSWTGKTVEATVTQPGTGWRGGGRYAGQPIRVVEYTFQNATGQQQTGRDELPSGSNLETGQTIKIEFVPACSWMSRVEGNGADLGYSWLVYGVGATVFLGLAWFVRTRPAHTVSTSPHNQVKHEVA